MDRLAAFRSRLSAWWARVWLRVWPILRTVIGVALLGLTAWVLWVFRPVAWDNRFLELMQSRPENANIPWGWLEGGREAFRVWTRAYRVPGRLAYELFHEESRGKVNAYNATSRCRGLGQIHETTAEWFHRTHPSVGLYRNGKLDTHRLYEPAINVRVSLWAFRWALDKHKDNAERALVSYNAGYGTWGKAAAGQTYAESILSRTSWKYRVMLAVRKQLIKLSVFVKGESHVTEETN